MRGPRTRPCWRRRPRGFASLLKWQSHRHAHVASRVHIHSCRVARQGQCFLRGRGTFDVEDSPRSELRRDMRDSRRDYGGRSTINIRMSSKIDECAMLRTRPQRRSLYIAFGSCADAESLAGCELRNCREAPKRLALNIAVPAGGRLRNATSSPRSKTGGGGSTITPYEVQSTPRHPWPSSNRRPRAHPISASRGHAHWPGQLPRPSPDSPACQGRTMHVVDAERKDPDDLDAAWLHLYAMLSRATKVKHIMLMRGPGPELLPRGPPADLAARLRAFDPCAERRWGEAEQLATHSLAQFLC
ncbi:unnamed protein product [Prorocentrum cordatum]|uniref:DNA helicase n=1 Tax=Prorocentrum cordatum TaxID=2364126 RepID=A0ABN9PE02_9DINO|nr:unnamed protein product [Polarella glacialis]